MAVLEAADAGAPVIVSDRGGLPELARRVGGNVVPAGDEAALARAITDAWNDTPRWRERARSAWQQSAALHGADAHVQKIEAIYRRAIETRRAA
jgi:glycosyltransferase involved in cell wall biosynthesis